MRGRNPREKKSLKVDLVDRLISHQKVLPKNPAAIDDVVDNWFIDDESQMAGNLIEELLNDSNAPVEYHPDTRDKFGLTDVDRACDYLEEIMAQPWFEI